MRNSDRTGVPHAPSEDAGEKIAASKTLEFVTSTSFVSLPSEGKYYPENHPYHNKKEIEIREMTAKEEDILTSRALIKKGVVIDRLLQSILIDEVDPKTLLVGDKGAILVETRISAYGADYDAPVTCPLCMTSTQHSFDLSALPVRYMSEILEDLPEGVEVTGSSTFLVTLPKSGYVVECRHLNGIDEDAIAKRAEMRKKGNLEEMAMTETLRAFVLSVEGREDRATINEFISTMSALDARFLRKTYQKMVPNLDMKQHFECSECSYEADLGVPLTAEFFWPES